MTCGIYRIYNTENGKSYVGQSTNVERRLRDHFRSLNRGVHPNSHFQRAFLFYGSENFEWQLLEACETTELTEKEQFWIDTAHYYAGVYNLARPEDSKKTSVEARRRMSESLKGRVLSEEHRRKISESQKGNQNSKGCTRTEEARRRISESKKGNQNCKGRRHTEEARRRMSEAKKGKVFSEEHRRNMSEAAKKRWRKHNEKSTVDCSAA